MIQASRARTSAARRPKLVSRFPGVVLVAMVAILVTISAGCGSSSSSGSMSAAQAQAVSQEFSTALQSALNTSLSSAARRGPRPSLATILQDTPLDQSGCVGSLSGETCDIPVSYTGNCPGGGTIGITGAFDFTLNSAGDGSDNTTLTITPTNCSVSNVTINGNPNVTASTQLNFTDDAIVFPITLSETGGISYGPNPSGSCTLNVQYTVSSATSCSVSGTVCGQSVSGSC
jgi:hypothetical protein